MKSKGEAKGAVVLSALFVLIFGVVVFVSSGYPRAARLMPLFVGSIALALAVIQFGKEVFRLFRAGKGAESGEGSKKKKFEGLPLWQMIGWILLCFGSILAVGFWWTAPVFIFVFLKFPAKQRWTTAVLSSGVFSGVLYALFEVGLKILMFRGFFFGASFG